MDLLPSSSLTPASSASACIETDVMDLLPSSSVPHDLDSVSVLAKLPLPGTCQPPSIPETGQAGGGDISISQLEDSYNNFYAMYYKAFQADKSIDLFGGSLLTSVKCNNKFLRPLHSSIQSLLEESLYGQLLSPADAKLSDPLACQTVLKEHIESAVQDCVSQIKVVHTGVDGSFFLLPRIHD
jgi:hypothetical protein